MYIYNFLKRTEERKKERKKEILINKWLILKLTFEDIFPFLELLLISFFFFYCFV